MEWFVLIFLVPLVLMPIVLLCGFVGCGIDDVATGGSGGGVEAPSDLHAKATGVDTIELRWQNNTGGPTNFEVERAASATTNYSEIGQTGAITLTDNKQLEAVVKGQVPGLVEGTTYFYRVRVNISSNHDGGAPSDVAKTTTFPATPTNLAATALDATHIKLSWNNASATAKKFIVQHRPSPINAWDAKPVYIGPETVLPNSTSLGPAITGTEDEFRVTAVVVNGFDDNVLKEVESVPSAPISAVISVQIPPAFKTAYDEGGLTANAPFGPNETLVQRIPAANLQNSGAKVRITLAKTTTDLVISKITVSQVRPGGKAYDSANDLKEVTSGGGTSGVFLKAIDPAKVLDVIDYNLDPTKDLLIAFHILGNSFSCPERTVIGARMFHKPSTNEADKPAAFNRAVGYATAVGPTPPGTGGVYLVKAIEVA